MSNLRMISGIKDAVRRSTIWHRYNVSNIRSVYTTTVVYDQSATVKPPAQKQPNWNRAVIEAEKIVGYPTSFLSLRWLLSDEIANVALHLRKLVGSNHPLLKMAKTLIYNGKNNMQAWGLIVLLISKAVGHAPSVSVMEQDKSAGVLHSQRALAEVTEMIRTASLVHQGLVNLQPLENSGNELCSDSDIIFGNKIALLSGDYLLGSSVAKLSDLNNQELIELMATTVRDLAESSFVGERDMQNNPLPSKPQQRPDCKEVSLENDDFNFGDLEDNIQSLNIDDVLGSPEREWTLRNTLAAGSLLGKSCQGALILAGQPKPLQKQAYIFGKHLSLAWQACIDMEPFRSSHLAPGARFSIISAPVMFHLEYDPSLYEEIIRAGRESVDSIDYVKVHREVMSGPGLEQTYKLQKKHSLRAMGVLEELPLSDARTALQNIILAMDEV